MHGCSGFILLALVGCALAVNRNGRWFNRGVNTVTKVVKEKQLVTESTPSSCVIVQTSLPACRHLRAVNIQPTQSVQIMQTEAPSPHATGQGWQPIIQPSDPLPPPTPGVLKAATPEPPTTSTSTSSWGWNFFSPREVTVTQTVRELYTTKYMDPNTVVTFSVKGCRPSRLPFDLPECQPPRQQHQQMTPTPEDHREKGIIVMAPIQFVPPMNPIRTSEPVKEEVKEEAATKKDEKEKKKEEDKKEQLKDVGI